MHGFQRVSLTSPTEVIDVQVANSVLLAQSGLRTERRWLFSTNSRFVLCMKMWLEKQENSGKKSRLAKNT